MKCRKADAFRYSAPLVFVIAIVMLSACGGDLPNSDDPMDDFDAFVGAADRFLAESVDRRHLGVAAAFLDSKGSIRVVAHGVADVRSGEPISGDSIFQVASISKTVTAYGVMKLFDHGQVRLDDPVEEYLTRYRLPDSRYDPAGVTIRRVLSHTAGLSLSGDRKSVV